MKKIYTLKLKSQNKPILTSISVIIKAIRGKFIIKLTL